MGKSKERATVQQDPEEIIQRPVLAKAIVEIAVGFQKILASGLNERAIVCLVHESSGVGKPDIRAVLKGLTQLKQDFCR